MENRTISSFAKWQVKKGNLTTVLNLLSAVADASMEEEGNLLYKVYQDQLAQNTILLFEQYTNEQALIEHRSTAHFKDIVISQIIPLLENRSVIVTKEVDLSTWQQAAD